MPGAVPILSTIGKVLFTGATIGSGIGGFIATTAIRLVGGMAVSAGLRALIGTPEAPSVGNGIVGGGRQLQFAPASNAPRQFIYGETLVRGQPVFTKTSGEKRQFLDMVIALGDTGDAPYESVEAIYFNEELLTLDGSGNVTAPSKYSGKAQIVIALGGDSQTAITQAVTNISEWTSDHRGRGVCHAYVRLTWDQDVWTGGQPQIKFKVRGRKCYDPRLDSTNGGSGSHRADDATTWEWTQNRVLWNLDWVRSIKMSGTRIAGIGAPNTLIDWDAWADAADVCDEDVNVSGGGIIKRYTGGGGLVASDDDPATVAKTIASCYAGEFAPRSGYIATFAGAARTATVTLTDDDLAGSIRLRTAKSMRDTVNTIQAQYREPEESYDMTDAPAYANGTWITLDGEEYYSQIGLPFEDDHRRAQRISKVVANRLRAPRELEASWKQKALQVREGDAFTWSSARFPVGVVGKYICTNRSINADGTVTITARSEDDAGYAWDEATEEATRTTPASISEPETGFDLETFDRVAYRNSLLGSLPEYSLGLAFDVSIYDSNTGAGLSYEDNVKLGSGQVQDSLGNDLGDADVRNNQITIADANASDLMRYGGGGNYTGDLAATLGADWSSNVTSRPTELTDGRITGAIDSSGDLLAGVTIAQVGGSTKRGIGRALGVIEVQDGDSVTFANNFSSPPKIRILGGTGLTYSTTLETTSGVPVTNNQAMNPSNVTTSGFDVSAKIRAEVTATSQNDTVTNLGTGSDPDIVGDKGVAAEAFDDRYTFNVTVSGTAIGGGGPIFVTIGFYTNDGTGWVQRATQNLAPAVGAFSTAIAETVTVDGLGQHGSEEFGISIELVSNVSGAALSSASVDYETAASVTETNATPGTQTVYAFVFESDEALE